MRRDQSQSIVDINLHLYVGQGPYTHAQFPTAKQLVTPLIFLQELELRPWKPNGTCVCPYRILHRNRVLQYLSGEKYQLLVILPDCEYGRLTARCTIIKNNHCFWLPRKPDLEIMARGDMINQKLEQGFRFRVLPPLNPLNEFPIDEYGLLPSHRVNTNDWVRTSDGIFAAETSVYSRKPAHLFGRMCGSEILEHRSKSW